MQEANKKEGGKMLSGVHSALSGLQAFSKKVDSIANNVANVNTNEFKKTRVTLTDKEPQGVVANVEKIETPGPLALEQTQDGEKLIEQSNVELSEELPNLMLSRRFFQANLKVIETEDEILGSLLDIKG